MEKTLAKKKKLWEGKGEKEEPRIFLSVFPSHRLGEKAEKKKGWKKEGREGKGVIWRGELGMR